eukprot:scaffold213720_cov40-Tisochrysis_lutea.AAC.2
MTSHSTARPILMSRPSAMGPMVLGRLFRGCKRASSTSVQTLSPSRTTSPADIADAQATGGRKWGSEGAARAGGCGGRRKAWASKLVCLTGQESRGSLRWQEPR